MELRTARVFVEHLDAAKRFYAECLNLPIKADGSAYGYCVFQAGAMDLVVESLAEDAPPEDKALVGRFTGLSFTVQDIVATHQALAGRGVRFTGLPERQPWGGILATFRDPAGNELQIVQHPAVA